MAYPRPISVIVCPTFLVSRFLLSVSHSQTWARTFGSQASRINPGQKEPGNIAKEYDGDQKIHQCTHVGGKFGG